MDLNFGKPLSDGLNVVGHGWYGHGTHAGLDIAIPVGTPIVSISDGFVSRVGFQAEMGNYVVVTDASGVNIRYLHLSRQDVIAGQAISKGDAIGASGNTGLSAGPHLHIDLKAPAELIEEIRTTVGEPTTGFEANVTGFGVGFPAEPWIPVDSYAPSVEATMAQYGIPLYQPRGVRALFKAKPMLWLFGALGFVAGAFVYSKRKP